MEFSELAELDDVLESLTVSVPDRLDEFTEVTIFPSHHYSMRPGTDVVVWYRSALKEQFNRLRAIVKRALAERGAGDSHRFADAAIFAFALKKPVDNRTAGLYRILQRTAPCDLSQFFLIPTSAFFSIWGDPDPGRSISIGHVDLGPFFHAPFTDDTLATVLYRVSKTGVQGDHCQALTAKEGTICIGRAPRAIKVLDLDALNIKGNSNLEVDLLNYYFDDVAEYWFDEFWREHMEWQVTLAASGAEVLDRASLYGVPGYTELSIFLGISVNGRTGTVSMIEETRHLRDSIGKRFYNFMQDCSKVKDRWKIELGPEQGPLYFGAVLSLARYITRSREMKLRGFKDEAFVLLITGLEALISDNDDSIAKNISRRIAVIISLTENRTLDTVRKEIARLYGVRSRFVHAAVPVDPELLPKLEHVCECVYFTALRSQISTKPEAREQWRTRWLMLLDYLFATSSAGLPPDTSAFLETGIRKRSEEIDSEKTTLAKYPKMRQADRFEEIGG